MFGQHLLGGPVMMCRGRDGVWVALTWRSGDDVSRQALDRPDPHGEPL